MAATSSVFTDTPARPPYSRPDFHGFRGRRHWSIVTDTGTELVSEHDEAPSAWTEDEFTPPDDARKSLLKDQVEPEPEQEPAANRWRAMLGSVALHTHVSRAPDITSSIVQLGLPTPDFHHFEDAIKRELARLSARVEVDKRLAELRVAAQDENIPLSEVSLRTFRRFLQAYPTTKKPLITLLDNGNLRAVWKDDRGQQVGLQFRAPDEIQFVLFAKRAGSQAMTRTAGRDTFEALPRQIEAHGLMGLLLP
jgi:hypothetical protein